MEGQLSLWAEASDSGHVAVWDTLDNTQQAEVVAMVTRLIVKLVATAANRESPNE